MGKLTNVLTALKCALRKKVTTSDLDELLEFMLSLNMVRAYLNSTYGMTYYSALEADKNEYICQYFYSMDKQSWVVCAKHQPSPVIPELLKCIPVATAGEGAALCRIHLRALGYPSTVFVDPPRGDTIAC